MKKILFNSKAFLGAVKEKISDAACKTGKGIQEYMEDEENIRHISLVVYDLMPLSVKFGLRHEKFYQQFKFIFVGIRKKLFPHSKVQSTSKIKSSVGTTQRKKTEIKPTVSKVTKKVVVKNADNKSIKKPRVKKTPDKREV